MKGWLIISKIFFSFSIWSTCLLWIISFFFIALRANLLFLSFFRWASLTFPKAPIVQRGQCIISLSDRITQLSQKQTRWGEVWHRLADMVNHLTYLLQESVPRWSRLSCMHRKTTGPFWLPYFISKLYLIRKLNLSWPILQNLFYISM